MPYYAIANGRKTGVVQSWDECKSQVTGYSNARYKKFNTAAEASAFVSSNGSSTSNRASTVNYSHPPSYSSYSASRSRVTKPTTTTYKPTTKNPSDMQHVYVDGASRGNGKVRNPKAGYGVYYGNGDERNAAVPLSKVDDGRTVTNQRAELHAMNHALDNISQEISRGNAKEYTIHSDSKYTLRALDEWADKWKSNGWRTSAGEPVKNRDLIEKAVNKMADINKEYKARGMPPVKLAHVAGHAGIHGNEMADRLANQGADND